MQSRFSGFRSIQWRNSLRNWDSSVLKGADTSGARGIDPDYLGMLKRSRFDGPLILYIEYDVSGGNFPGQARLAYQLDFTLLRIWMASKSPSTDSNP